MAVLPIVWERLKKVEVYKVWLWLKDRGSVGLTITMTFVMECVPKCGELTARLGWWCLDCLKVKVFESRAALSVCHCADGKEPHRHTVDGGVA
jgi:hypothetical protein